MEKKIKLAIIGLVGLLSVSFIIILQISGSKQSVERQINKLNGENDSLRKQLDNFSQDKRQLEEKISSLNSGLDKAAKEKEELEKKYEAVNKVKEVLREKLKSQKTRIATLQERPLEAKPQAQTEDAYWSGILKAKTELEVQLANSRAELKTLQINNEQLQKEKSSLELDITGLNRDREDSSRQSEYNQKLVDSLTSELVREKNDKFKIRESLKSLKGENATLKRQLNNLNTRKLALDRKLLELQERNKVLDSRFAEMDVYLKEKMSEDIPAASVNLPPIVVHSSASPAPAIEGKTSLMARISEVNRDNNFVVIDSGEDKGVKLGDTFGVYRNNKQIGAIEVVQARQSIAACDIKNETTPLKVGDTVKYSN